MDGSIAQSDRRQDARNTVRMSAVISAGDQRAEGEVHNLSKKGAKVLLQMPWDGDGAVQIEVGHFGSCEGRVEWTEGNFVGIRFTKGLTLLTCFLGGV